MEMRMNVRNIAVAAALAACGLGAGGCAPVMLTALGVGMATEVSHTLGGMVYKTFTAPQAQVKRASIGALNRMQIKVLTAKREGTTETIRAHAADRDIEIELEALTPATTRMLVTAKKDGGILRDGATATEIILQTEKYVGST
ncbi:MAG TPA: DUF3568 family protein [Usitatibacter sp.]|jgi:hypothetical protein|nr:DUF3568 family protein [Usitatibacter sp.]